MNIDKYELLWSGLKTALENQSELYNSMDEDGIIGKCMADTISAILTSMNKMENNFENTLKEAGLIK